MSFKTKTIRLPSGVVLPYAEQGNADGLTVVFVHGLSDSHLSYGPLFDALPKSLHAIAVTMRGHGDATKPERGYAPEDMASDLAAFLDALNIGRVVLAGHSMGSVVARAFADRYPTRLRGLVLIGAFSSLHDNAGVKEFADTVLGLADPVPREFAHEFQVSTLANPVPAAFLTMAVDESMKLPATVWHQTITALTERDLSRLGAGLPVPSLLIWGDKDTFVLRADQEALCAVLNDVRLVVYEGVGHAVHWEKPERVAETLMNWLKLTRRSAKRAA